MVPELFLIFICKNLPFHSSWIWKWYSPQGRERLKVELSFCSWWQSEVFCVVPVVQDCDRDSLLVPE